MNDHREKNNALAALSLCVLCRAALESPRPVQEKTSLPQAEKGSNRSSSRARPIVIPLKSRRKTSFARSAFDSPVGKLAAYLSSSDDDGQKHPAIIWITGGDCNSIGDVWSPAPAGATIRRPARSAKPASS